MTRLRVVEDNGLPRGAIPLPSLAKKILDNQPVSQGERLFLLRLLLLWMLEEDTAASDSDTPPSEAPRGGGKRAGSRVTTPPKSPSEGVS